MQFVLAVRVYLTRGFDVIHACNPPDSIFLVAFPFKLFGVSFSFDINPENMKPAESMSREERRYLPDYYREEIMRLGTLLGRDIESAWVA